MAMPDSDSIGYAVASQVYWDRGWRGVLPLKRGSKWPPPKGFTGYDGADPSYADTLQWGELYPDGNVCLRLPDGVIGIDVDAYGAKTGAKAFAEAVKRWGPLPDGPQSSSREDDLTSGLRLFRVPEGTLLEDVIVFPELSIGDIEVIQRHHRYVVCWPSIHPEGRGYWWRNSRGQILGVPELADIPELPGPWLDGLKMTPRSLEISGEGYDTRLALTEGEPSVVVQARLAQAIKELNLPGMSRHDTCTRHVMALLRHGREGQPGVEQALTLLREVFVAVACLDGSRTTDEAVDEFNRMVTNRNVARELSQPGILDWFRRVMEGSKSDPPGDGPGAQSANVEWADAGAVLPVAATPPPPDPTGGGELELLEEDFWTSRPQHQLIFDAALSRMASPWAVFAFCVVRALAMVPPSITLPAIIGGRGSLNWFAAITAASGGGKGAAKMVARDLISTNIAEKPIGSGEGMIECYNRGPQRLKKGEEPLPPVVSVMFEVDEIDTLGAMHGRSGQTTMVMLRQGFSGEQLGFSYRSRTNEVVASHTYRMTLVAAVQPARAGALLDDSAGGTPQRFMWFPGRDRRIVENPPGWPTDVIGEMLSLNPYLAADRKLMEALGPAVIPDEAAKLIRSSRAADMRGESGALDGHALYCREKLAYALAYMDGRTEVQSEDWRLSGIAAAVSDWERNRTLEAYQSAKENESRERGQIRGVEAAAAELGKASEQMSTADRVRRNVLRKITQAGPEGLPNRRLIQAIASADRMLLKPALDAMTSQGLIAQIEGTTSWVAI